MDSFRKKERKKSTSTLSKSLAVVRGGLHSTCLSSAILSSSDLASVINFIETFPLLTPDTSMVRTYKILGHAIIIKIYIETTCH